MSSDPDFNDVEDTDESYTLEFIAAHAGVDAQVILRYQRKGFIRAIATGAGAGGWLFDNEALRQVRRIEHLRVACEVNEDGLALILGLLREVDMLREERRRTRR
jgi:MerR family transcriptional regulator/heat shock protein HspR